MAAALSSSRILEHLTTVESGSDFGEDSDDDFNVDCQSSETSDNETGEEPSGSSSQKRPRLQQESTKRTPISSKDWKDDDFVPTNFPFIVNNAGVNVSTGITEDSSVLDIFKTYFNRTVLECLVVESNKYYSFLCSLGPLQEKSKLQRWHDTNINEMYIFIGLVMLMSLQKRPKISDYWSTDPLMGNPIFGKVMSSLRFTLLMRMLHFNDNNNQVAGDRLFKIRPIVEAIRKSFKESFQPHQNLVIDESLMLWKGRLSFKQYIPSKRHRFGIKLFLLCDCLTGYVIDFIIYTGTTTEIINVEDGMGKSGAIVLTLMEPYLNKGHTLFTDNWYTSPALSTKLHKEKTGTCGTVKRNRKGMPAFPQKLKVGDRVEKHCDELLAIKWHDRRDVHLLTTVDEMGEAPSGKKDRHTKQDIMKPKCVINYNKNMGAVDKSDMQISFTECVRKSVKWYKKLFFHFLDLAALNAYIVYKEVHHAKLDFGDFRLELIRQIIETHNVLNQSPKGGRTSTAQSPLRLTERHFPMIVPPTEKKKNAARKCTVCAKTNLQMRCRKETRYMCEECDVGLCIQPCFKLYHTVSNF